MLCRVRWLAFASLVATVCAGARPVTASVFGDVRGQVVDPQMRPIARARVELRASGSGFAKDVDTDTDGSFTLRAIPLGEYVVRVEAPGFSKAERRLTVVSDSAPLLRVRLAIAPIAETTEVKAPGPASDSVTPAALVDKQQILETAGADRANSLAMITSFTPGAYMTHDQLHIRGGHQVSWLVDGVPIPNTNIASNVGPQIDPKDIDFLEVQRGAYSAEFGDRTYGVFNVVPRSGFDYSNEAELVASYGSFNQTNDQLRCGGHSERTAYYVSITGNSSDFGLATPTAEVLHDRARGLGAFTSLSYRMNDRDQLRLAASGRGDDYHIPNDPDSQSAGVADVQQERDAFVNLSWVHQTGNLLLTVSPFYHFNRADYLGQGGDDRVIPTDKHDSHYIGGQVVLSGIGGRNRWKAGLYGFYQHDDASLALRSSEDPTQNLAQAQSLEGDLEAAFLEDQVRPADWITLTGGLRFTHFGGQVNETVWSPRLGASARIPGTPLTARGFWGRYYQAPPLQTVSGPILDFALQEGFGFLPLEGERDEEYQFGLSASLQDWDADLNYFHTAARNFFDHDALDDSNIFFPLTIDRARIRGLEVMLKSPLIGGRARVALVYSHQIAGGAGAVTGGLTDFSPPEEGYFYLDHDQRHTLNLGSTFRLTASSYVSGAVHYGSGFVDGEGPEHLPGHVVFDLGLGKTFGRAWRVDLHATNVGDQRFLLDNSPTFGGTHYVDPGQVTLRVIYRFHL